MHLLSINNMHLLVINTQALQLAVKELNTMSGWAIDNMTVKELNTMSNCADYTGNKNKVVLSSYCNL